MIEQSNNTRRGHARLDAYRVALQLFREIEKIAAELPRGYSALRSQLRRAAVSTVLNIAEAANRTHARDRAARFAIARGESGECEAALEMINAIRLIEGHRLAPLRRLAERTSSMLTGLILRETRLADRAPP